MKLCLDCGIYLEISSNRQRRPDRCPECFILHNCIASLRFERNRQEKLAEQKDSVYKMWKNLKNIRFNLGGPDGFIPNSDGIPL